MRVLVACEFTGRVRRAFTAMGHHAVSCDLLDAEDFSVNHLRGDVREFLDGFGGGPWDLLIAHPPCTRMANAGVRWLDKPPPGRTKEEMWRELDEDCEFYCELRDCGIPKIALENPVMHKHARERIGIVRRQIVQPWWFGEPYFKATGFELIGLPDLVPTNKLVPPKRGTPEHKAWSKVHLEPPGPDRWKNRSRTFPGIAAAMAQQWGAPALAEAA